MKPIQLNFKSSIIASALFTLMSVGACCIVMLLTISSPIKLALLVAIILSGLYAVLQHGLRRLPSSCVALKVDAKNQLQLVRKDGRTLDVLVQANTVVTPYLTVLNSRTQSASLLPCLSMQHLLIFPDAVDANGYRQLRVWLRWGYDKP